MDGYEATQLIRQQEKYKNLPVIAMTANTMKGDKEKVLKAGMNDHIAKPIDEEVMFITMAKWITPHVLSDQFLSEPVHSDRVLSDAEIRTSSETSNDNIDEQFRGLYGIDVKSGLKMAHHNNELYRKILLRYQQDYSEILNHIKQLQKEENYTSLKSIAHKLKGESAHLAINTIAEIAKQLEIACIENVEDASVCINKLELELPNIIQTLDKLKEIPKSLNGIGDNSTGENGLNFPSEDQVKEYLNEILILIKTDVLAAENKLDELIALYPAQSSPKTLEQISEHLFNIDYEEASNLINQLLEE